MINRYRDTLIVETVGKIGQKVKIAGWLQNKRDHGSLLFLEIRDHSGIIQVVINNPVIESTISIESVLIIKGIVKKREESQINSNMLTGYIEIVESQVSILSRSEVLPFNIQEENLSEELKFKYRNLYIRSDRMQKNLIMRDKMIKLMRKFLETDFLEIATPILTVSTPEGARDFIIPSRLHAGKFYALPQSPQIFKQLLMTGGINRYYQIAPCFRDEDARKDRLYGEFYQLDVEMAFVTQDDVLNLLTELVCFIIKNLTNKDAQVNRLTYEEAISLYGTDKPDLRIPLHLTEYTEIFNQSEMDLFKKMIKNGSVIQGIKCHLDASQCDKVLNYSIQCGFRIAYISKQDNNLKGPISKFLPNHLLENNESIIFICDTIEKVRKNGDLLIRFIGYNFYHVPSDNYQIVQIIDFPMFEKDSESNTGYSFTHNPFSMPKEQVDDTTNLLEVLAFQYDLVLNGYEIASGSIRNNNSESLINLFIKCGYTKEQVIDKFHSLVSAYQFGGVPPHGGFGLGIERLLMILINEVNVREIVAFPLNTNGQDPLTNSPAKLDSKTLKLLHIQSLVT